MPPPAGSPTGRRLTVQHRRSRALLPTVLVVVGLLVLFGVFTNFYTDLLWFRSVDFAQVFATELRTKALLFVVFGALLGGSVALNFVLAYRSRPAYAPISPEQQNLDRYRAGVEPFRRILVLGAAAVLALIAGSSAAGQWRTFLLWRNGQSFGSRDPQFNVDVSFFAFALPWWRFVLGFVFTTLVLSLLAAAATHYLYGGLRLQGSDERTSPAARVHLSVLLGLFVLAKAVAYWLDRYALAVKDDRIGGRPFTGLRYADANALLTAKTVLAGIAVICALLFFATVVVRTWLLPGIGVGLLLLAAVLLGGIIPATVQYFQVRPNEPSQEREYLGRNIAATRAAYDVADAASEPYRATTQVSAEQLAGAERTEIPGTRLLDPAVVSPTFRQLQQIRGYYGFNDSLDIGRYMVDGQPTDLVLAVRELNQQAQPNRNWINDHLTYTHGFGLVAARGNGREANGEPTFVERDIPPTGVLGEFEPRIYFGETSPPYSIVGAPQGAPEREVDFPDDNAPNGARNNTYRGSGGVPVGSPLNRLLYAVKFQEEQILLSGLINGQSKVLYVRSPRERVAKVAPWLELDGDPYPAVVDGRVLWIVDGYTTTAGYPYSSHTTLQDATTDTLAVRTTAVANQPNEQVNYIRNSVKATVDAYDGTVTLYEWDDTDPVLKTWRRAFPGTVKARGEISGALLQHLRYPQDLFKVQRELLANYHVTDPVTFYRGENVWEVPKDPTNPATDQPPYYLTVQVPGQERPTFSLTTSFVLRARPNLTAFAAVEAEPGEDYGKIRLLELPANTTIAGPVQAYNAFQANPEVSSALNLLSRGGSEVQFGNLLTLPVAGGLLYVEPVYVKAQGANSYPLLQRVRVSFGDRIGFAETLPDALRQVFTAAPGTSPAPPPGEGPPGGSPTPAPSVPPGDPANPQLARALADAQAALRDADEAFRRGDFAAYGAAQRRLADAVNRAAAVQGVRPSGSPSPSAPGGRRASGTPSPPAASPPAASAPPG